MSHRLRHCVMLCKNNHCMTHSRTGYIFAPTKNADADDDDNCPHRHTISYCQHLEESLEWFMEFLFFRPSHNFSCTKVRKSNIAGHASHWCPNGNCYVKQKIVDNLFKVLFFCSKTDYEKRIKRLTNKYIKHISDFIPQNDDSFATDFGLNEKSDDAVNIYASYMTEIISAFVFSDLPEVQVDVVLPVIRDSAKKIIKMTKFFIEVQYHFVIVSLFFARCQSRTGWLQEKRNARWIVWKPYTAYYAAGQKICFLIVRKRWRYQ